MGIATITIVSSKDGPIIEIGYESESDALAHEHERDHRAIMKELGLTPADLEEHGIKVVRKTPVGPQENAAPESAQKQREGIKSHGYSVRRNPNVNAVEALAAHARREFGSGVNLAKTRFGYKLSIRPTRSDHHFSAGAIEFTNAGIAKAEKALEQAIMANRQIVAEHKANVRRVVVKREKLRKR